MKYYVLHTLDCLTAEGVTQFTHQEPPVLKLCGLLSREGRLLHTIAAFLWWLEFQKDDSCTSCKCAVCDGCGYHRVCSYPHKHEGHFVCPIIPLRTVYSLRMQTSLNSVFLSGFGLSYVYMKACTPQQCPASALCLDFGYLPSQLLQETMTYIVQPVPVTPGSLFVHLLSDVCSLTASGS